MARAAHRRSQLWRAAHREAGRAVMAHLHGHEIVGRGLGVIPGSAAGYCDLNWTLDRGAITTTFRRDPYAAAADAREALAIAFAGRAAEAVATRCTRNDLVSEWHLVVRPGVVTRLEAGDAGGGEDLDVIARVLGEWTDAAGEDLDVAGLSGYQHAAALLRDAETWRAVQTIAAALAERGILAAHDANAMLHAAAQAEKRPSERSEDIEEPAPTAPNQPRLDYAD